jgi:pimeloyl-ACP methyl ester carboxylesterase
MAVDEHTIEVAGGPVFYRYAQPAGPTVLYLHSAPTSSDDWVPSPERTGGLAPDLLGYGRSSKAGFLQYTLAAYVDFLEQFLAVTDAHTVTLVGHGWGAAIGLVFAQRHAHRVDRIAIIDAVPLFDGFQWPPLVRRLRLRGIGELLMGSVNQWLLARTLRAASASPAAWPDERVATVYEQFDQGTQRAILRLHRATQPATLAAAGADLGELWAPSLVVWGEDDPWLHPSLAEGYARRLPRAELERVPAAGHWPWLDQSDVIDRVAAFVTDTP